jgi:hypothetical protein
MTYIGSPAQSWLDDYFGWAKDCCQYRQIGSDQEEFCPSDFVPDSGAGVRGKFSRPFSLQILLFYFLLFSTEDALTDPRHLHESIYIYLLPYYLFYIRKQYSLHDYFTKI